jgi:hypothetical protein
LSKKQLDEVDTMLDSLKGKLIDTNGSMKNITFNNSKTYFEKIQ